MIYYSASKQNCIPSFHQMLLKQAQESMSGLTHILVTYCHITNFFKIKVGASLVVQWLKLHASNTGSMYSMPGGN